MSASEISSPVDLPDTAEIEQTLRQVVREALTQDTEITVNLARTRAESQLGLEAGYLKNTGDWKQRSKDIINAAVEDPPSPAGPSRAAPRTKPKPASRLKRTSEDVPPAQKRQRKAVRVESEEDEEDESSSPGSKNRSSKRATNGEDVRTKDRDVKDLDRELMSQAKDDSDLSDPPEDTRVIPSGTSVINRGEDSESDLSSVIDDPPPRKRQQKSSSTKTKSNAKAASKSTTSKPKTAGKESSPDEEEIKRLQGWLVKCGVRKLWHRELAQHETSKDKIRHLKTLLADVGMTGRYSVEKAKQIKERRELAAELQSAQEYNEQWGRSGSEGAEEGKGISRPRRTAPKGLVDFGDSGDSSG